MNPRRDREFPAARFATVSATRAEGLDATETFRYFSEFPGPVSEKLVYSACGSSATFCAAEKRIVDPLEREIGKVPVSATPISVDVLIQHPELFASKSLQSATDCFSPDTERGVPSGSVSARLGCESAEGGGGGVFHKKRKPDNSAFPISNPSRGRIATMHHIIGPFRIAPGTAPTSSPRGPQTPQPASPSRISAPVDQLDLSPQAAAAGRADAASSVSESGIRVDKVAAIRRAIADGSYETPEKLDQALNRMLDEFA